MKKIIWDDTVATPDIASMYIAKLLLSEDTIYTGNSLVVNCAKLLVVQGKIEDLVIEVSGKEYPVNEYGALHNGPDGLYLFSEIAAKTLKAAIKKKT